MWKFRAFRNWSLRANALGCGVSLVTVPFAQLIRILIHFIWSIFARIASPSVNACHSLTPSSWICLTSCFCFNECGCRYGKRLSMTSLDCSTPRYRFWNFYVPTPLTQGWSFASHLPFWWHELPETWVWVGRLNVCWKLTIFFWLGKTGRLWQRNSHCGAPFIPALRLLFLPWNVNPRG